jgi:DNA-binding transcriptional MerR regulator
METLTVREAAALTGLSAHTLRYYERAGLLEPVARNASGHRRYARADLEHLQFLHCLRATGMPIRRMQEFAALARAGHATVDIGLELLEAHRRDVQAQIEAFERALGIIDAKIQRLRRHSAAPGVSVASLDEQPTNDLGAERMTAP